MTETTKRLTDGMRAVLAMVADHPDARLVHDFRNGWVLKRQVAASTVDRWARYEWIGQPKTLTVEALIRRNLLEVRVPRTTPGLYDVTAFLTDAGRVAAGVAIPPQPLTGGDNQTLANASHMAALNETSHAR